MLHILGSHLCLSIKDLKSFSKWEGYLEGKMLLTLDDSSDLSEHTMKIIKSWTTCLSHTGQIKNGPYKTFDSYLNVIMCDNQFDNIKFKAIRDDTKILMIDANRDEKVYYDKLYQIVDNEGEKFASVLFSYLYYYIKKDDIGNYYFHMQNKNGEVKSYKLPDINEVPVVKLKKDVTQLPKCPIDLFFNYIKSKDVIKFPVEIFDVFRRNKFNNENYIFSITEVFRCFQVWSERIGYTGSTSHTFREKLLENKFILYTSNRNLYALTGDQNKRVPCFYIKREFIDCFDNLNDELNNILQSHINDYKIYITNKKSKET